MVILNKTSIKFGKKVVINKVSNTFEPYKINFIYGDEGSGKTSLLRAISGLERYRGSIKVKGKLFYLFDEMPFYEYLSGYENLKHFINHKNLIDFYEVNNALLLSKSKLNQQVSSYSIVERKLLGIMLMMVYNSNVLLLDDVFNGLNLEQRFVFIDCLTKLKGKATIIITGHDQHYLEIADVYYHLKDGSLKSQSHEQVKEYFSIM